MPVKEDLLLKKTRLKKDPLRRISFEGLPSSCRSCKHMETEHFVSCTRRHFDSSVRKCFLASNTRECFPVSSTREQLINRKVKEFFPSSDMRRHSLDGRVERCSHNIYNSLTEHSLVSNNKNHLVDTNDKQYLLDSGKSFLENKGHFVDSEGVDCFGGKRLQRGFLDGNHEGCSENNICYSRDNLLCSLRDDTCHWYDSTSTRVLEKKYIFQEVDCLPVLPMGLRKRDYRHVSRCSYKVDLSSKKSFIDWKHNDYDDFFMSKFRFTKFYSLYLGHNH
ncbi:hypothetical protein OTU49_007765 [Cherax quadricarinatus]|uniref:Uncharacterized protein n=1 Tax=Cherax quadricarinatus TaxID=27406 RepID=A0AAW0WVN6_CHEQU